MKDALTISQITGQYTRTTTYPLGMYVEPPPLGGQGKSKLNLKISVKDHTSNAWWNNVYVCKYGYYFYSRSVPVSIRLLPKLFSSFQQLRGMDMHQVKLYTFLSYHFNHTDFLYKIKHYLHLFKPNFLVSGGNVGGTRERNDASTLRRPTSLHANAPHCDNRSGTVHAYIRSHSASAFPHCDLLAGWVAATF